MEGPSDVHWAGPIGVWIRPASHKPSPSNGKIAGDAGRQKGALSVVDIAGPC